MDKSHWQKKKRLGLHGRDAHDGTKKDKKHDGDLVFLSVLLAGDKKEAESSKVPKPLCGDLIVGRINRHMPLQRAPALMFDLRGGFAGRCCITELDEVDDWVNMPLGKLDGSQVKEDDKHIVVTDEEEENANMDVDDESVLDHEKEESTRCVVQSVTYFAQTERSVPVPEPTVKCAFERTCAQIKVRSVGVERLTSILLRVAMNY
jgi:hypothetical protein